MKNFRKVLALVLVVATLFSFASVAGAYTDDASVTATYEDAVDVLSAIGILNGYPDGSFKPTNTITRGEMAKMIAVLSNAGDDVSDLYASACTFADAKTNWAASYIAYCAQTGIVAGRNATTFDPNGKVTGLETAKMLLVVLGLDAAEQGYVGANWKVNVLRDAKEFGLLNGFVAGYKVDAAITREEAAQMMLNALCAPMVAAYISDNIVTIANKVVLDAEGTILPSGAHLTVTDAKANGWTILYGNVVVSGTPLANIYKGLDVTYTVDCFGNPAYAWVYVNPVTKKPTTIGTYAFAADKTYTTAADLTTDYSNQIKSGSYTIIGFQNGKPVLNVAAPTTPEQKTAAVAAVEAFEDNTGNGVLTQAYVVPKLALIGIYGVNKDDATEYGLVITTKNSFVGEVANVSRLNKTFDIVYADGTPMASGVKGTDVKNGEIVLFHACNGSCGATANFFLGYKIHDYKVITPVATAKVTRGVNYNDDPNASYFIAGETYKYNTVYGSAYNWSTGNATVVTAPLTAANGNGKTYNIYVDEYGYVMLLTAPAAAAKVYTYAYADGSALTHGNVGETVDAEGNATATCDDTAGLVIYTGTNGTRTVEKKAVDHVAYEKFAERNHYESGNGMLTKFEEKSGELVYVDDADYAPAGTKLSKTSWVINATAGIYADEDTVFMIRTKNAAGGYTYTETVGYKSLDKDYISYDFTYEYPVEYGTNIQYFADNNGWAEYVFIDAVYTAADIAKFVVMGELNYTAFDNAIAGIYADDYKAYSVLINGVESVILVDKTNDLTKANIYEAKTMYIGAVLNNELEKNLPLYAAIDFVQAPDMQATTVTIHKDSKNNYWATISTETTRYKLADGFKWLLIDADKTTNDYDGYTVVTEWIQDGYVEGSITESDVYVITSGGEIVLVYQFY